MRPATVLRLVTSAALILFLSFASMATAPNTSVTFVQASGGCGIRTHEDASTP